MTIKEFEQLVAEEFPKAIPQQFQQHIKNVAFLVEDEPSAELRIKEGLHPNETLLGHYHGIPTPTRGGWYGMGTTMPDTITLFRAPIENAAAEGAEDVRKVIRETIWHEVAHHFGMNEREVRRRESEREE